MSGFGGGADVQLMLILASGVLQETTQVRLSLHSWGRPESTADSTGHLDSGEPLPAMNEDQYREFGRMLTATAEDVMNVPDTYVDC